MNRHQQAERIRQRREQLGHICGSNPCPEELKRDALACWAARKADGASEAAAAAELGIPALTLSRWRRAAAAPRFLPVVVEPAVAASPQLVVRGPCGLLVEGLDLDGLAQLLRRLA